MVLISGSMTVAQRAKVTERRGRNAQDFGQAADGRRDF
jgi:hypothetical protein